MDYHEHQCTCDHCQGVVWPAPKPISREEVKKYRKLCEDIAGELSKNIDKEILKIFNEVENGEC